MSPPAEGVRFVTFRVGSALYAVDIARVERVLRQEPTSPVPDMPPWMDGVLAYQDRILPVVDLRIRFGTPPSSCAGQGRLLVISMGTQWVAAAVDQVLDVRAIAAADIAPPPEMVVGLAGEFLRGVASRDGELVLILDFERILLASDRKSLADAARCAEVAASDAPLALALAASAAGAAGAARDA
ncbi:MAG: chemotaxis protein CheW [Gemmatimonadaceae bacterium]